MDTTLTQEAAPGPAWRSVLRPLITSGGYRAITHHLLGLPLGVAYFSWLVTSISAGLGLVVTLIGIPVLTLVLATIRPLLALERGLANSLLDARIAPSRLTAGGQGGLARVKAYWTDSTSWRGIVYLLGRFPVGLATFIVAVTAFATALYLIAAPAIAPFERPRARLLGARQRRRRARARAARARPAPRVGLDLRGYGRAVARVRPLGRALTGRI